MADEDEVDVEGDFDMDFGAEQEILPNLYIDMNEPPSKSANLLPEDTEHPWMLEQGWSLDHCTDEKSKAAIEKMLQEEQHYMNGRIIVGKGGSAGSSSSTNLQKQAQQRRTWTDEERKIFKQALEIYGRKWARISELIPNKTTQQVKSFGQHYFKTKAREEEDKLKDKRDPKTAKTTLPIGIQNAIQAVTTAQPTVKVSPKKLSTYYDNASIVWAKTTQASSNLSSQPLEALTSMKTGKHKVLPTPKKTSPTKDRKLGKAVAEKPQKKHLVSGLSGKTNTETVVNSLIANAEVVRIPSNRDENPDDESDVDIDIEDDSDIDDGKEDVVYRQLVESAGIISNVNGDNRAHENQTSIGKCSEIENKTKSRYSETDHSLTSEELEPSVTVKTESVDLHDKDSSKRLELQELPDKPIKKESQENVTKLGTVEPPIEENMILNTIETDDEIKQLESVHSSDEDGSDAHPDEYGIQNSVGEIVYLPNPVKEVILLRDAITVEEQNIHSEFFTQRPGQKTPDRYLRIRNFILDAWEKCRPNYLNKTSVRPGLRDCGDVNCIGRIHAYLEQIGAINYNCSQVQYLRTNRAAPVKIRLPKLKDSDSPAPRVDFPSRKRRVRDFDGQWIDEKELEGRTTEHREKDPLEKKPKIVRKRSTYDPFQLNHCSKFGEDKKAPFQVRLESIASVTMDVHAHLSKTEVIGLLGGKYVRSTSSSAEETLHITMAVPCESLSTGMQCEMDPVSQTEACQKIEHAGYSVVGWYHSHPTFAPDPSCRDIETQQKYQEWFGLGGNPFVGVIISPYSHDLIEHQSITRCVIVMNQADNGSSQGQPYEFNYTAAHEHWDTYSIQKLVSMLADKYATYPNRVHLLQRYRSWSSLTCLQKMIQSLSHKMPEMTTEDADSLQQTISTIIEMRYQCKEEKNTNVANDKMHSLTDIASDDISDSSLRVHPARSEEDSKVNPNENSVADEDEIS